MNQVAHLSQTEINHLVTLFQTAQYDEVIEQAQARIEQFPDSGFLWKVLGAALQVQGKEALPALQKSVELAPGDANAHSTLGNTWQALGQFEKAAACHQHALTLNPIDAGAYCNLGNAFKALGQPDQATHAYMQALRIDPNLAQAHQNLAAVFLGAGMYKEAALAASNAIKINPAYAEAYDCLSVALIETGQISEALNTFERLVSRCPIFANGHYHRAFTALYAGDQTTAMNEFIWVITNGPDNLKLEACVYAAVLRYIAGDLQSCKHLLNLSAAILNLETEHTNACVYWRYLALLISESPSSSATDLPALHVVGDSHSLSAAHAIFNYQGKQFQSKTEWIIGCKAWHLGNGQANRYKFQFEEIMKRLPRGSTFLLMFGEIDCRVSEGIQAVWKKAPGQDLANIVSKTVTGYFDYARTNAQRYGHTLIFSAVPCPAIDLDELSHIDARNHIYTIAEFNYQLKMACQSYGHAFLDVHTLTDAGKRVADGSWHIDDYHLKPAAIIEAFNRLVQTSAQSL